MVSYQKCRRIVIFNKIKTTVYINLLFIVSQLFHISRIFPSINNRTKFILKINLSVL